MLQSEQQQQLLAIARDSILHGLNTGEPLAISAEDYPATFKEHRAVFVTLKINSMLRGCIGTTNANAPLVENVANYAFNAAFNDPRFKPLEREEFDKVKISISILTPSEPIQFTSESDLVDQLCEGTDGLIIEKGVKRATFLPSVWESIPNKQDFLIHLKNKANIAEHESPNRAWRYYSESMLEK